jgi:hypothetical protein
MLAQSGFAGIPSLNSDMTSSKKVLIYLREAIESPFLAN